MHTALISCVHSDKPQAISPFCAVHKTKLTVHHLQAEKRMIEAEENKEYLPIDGLADFKKATLQLLLGSGHAAIKEVKALLHNTWHSHCPARSQRLA